MKKVVIGMSGGVDSSVAAYILQKQGYEVIGLFMRNWDSLVNNDISGNPNLNNNICPQEQDYNDALEVCKKLNIPLHRVDFVKEYWDYVFKYFLGELEKGRTPNPDLMCNKYIKFDLFKKEAEKLGADYVATGHYARIIGNRLCRAVDLNKDQTYFLAQVSEEHLKNVLFPIGDLIKPEVRKIADDLNLITAKKKDSTGICFIGERNYQKFISNYLKPNPGDIIDINTMKVIGTHSGLMNYTIGQRRNVGISGNSEKHFVVGKDVKKNVLYVAFGEDSKYLYSDSCIVDNVNYLCQTRHTFCTAKFRYRGEDHEVILEYLDNNEILVKYPSKVKAVTPGQACVFYLGEQCLGSGIIKTVMNNGEKLWYL
jgi:tRNA-uridine 2-sulfurtransferase